MGLRQITAKPLLLRIEKAVDDLWQRTIMAKKPSARSTGE